MNYRSVAVHIVIVLALLALVVGYGYTITHYPPAVYNVTYKQIDADPTEHTLVFEVMIFPGVDAAKVNRALMLAPNAFGYTIVPVDESRFFYTDPAFWVGSGGEPFPNSDESYLILIVDRDQYPNSTCGGWTTNERTGKIVILYDDEWSDMILSDIITHECAHNLEQNENVLDNYDKYYGEFTRWLAKQWYWDGATNGLNKNGMTRLYNDWTINELLSQSQVLSDACTSTQTISSSA